MIIMMDRTFSHGNSTSSLFYMLTVILVMVSFILLVQPYPTGWCNLFAAGLGAAMLVVGGVNLTLAILQMAPQTDQFIILEKVNPQIFLRSIGRSNSSFL